MAGELLKPYDVIYPFRDSVRPFIYTAEHRQAVQSARYVDELPEDRVVADANLNYGEFTALLKAVLDVRNVDNALAATGINNFEQVDINALVQNGKLDPSLLPVEFHYFLTAANRVLLGRAQYYAAELKFGDQYGYYCTQDNDLDMREFADIEEDEDRGIESVWTPYPLNKSGRRIDFTLPYHPANLSVIRSRLILVPPSLL